MTKKLPVWRKIGYGLGDLGGNLVYQPPWLFLLFYLTDVFGISPATAGLIMLSAKLWDGIFDPFFGYYSDKVHTRWGSKRPFLLWFAIPFGLAFALLFYGPALPANIKPVYAAITYTLLCTMISVINIPYTSLTAAMTTSSEERNSITVYRMILSTVGMILASAAFTPLVEYFGNGLTGYRSVGMIFGFSAAVLILICFLTVKENTTTNVHQRFTFRQVWKVLVVNKPYQRFVSATFLQFTAIGILCNAVNYYARYVFWQQSDSFFGWQMTSESFKSIGFLAIFLMTIIFMPLAAKISAKFGKLFWMRWGTLYLALNFFILIFFDQLHSVCLILILLNAGIGWTAVTLNPWSMLPDTVEYSEWKTGIRCDGLLFGIFNMLFKVSAAIAGVACGFALEIGGYIPNQAQSYSSLITIKLLIGVVPPLLLIIAFFIMGKYPISAALHRQMVNDINERKRVLRQEKC